MLALLLAVTGSSPQTLPVNESSSIHTCSRFVAGLFGETMDDFARRTLIAGDHVDGQGRKWTFGAGGRASSPERGTFTYAMQLDTSEACCDYFVIGEELVGYRWNEGKRELFQV